MKKHDRLRRNLSIVTTYVLVIGCVVWLLAFFIPEILKSLSDFVVILPQNVESLYNVATNFFNDINFVDSNDVIQALTVLFQPLIDTTKDLPTMIQTIISGGTLNRVLNSTFLAASTILNIILGIVIGFYMLSGKDRFGRDAKKIIYALTDEKKADRFIFNTKRINRIFEGFILGKTLDSLIIGCIFFVVVSTFKMPYTLLMSVIIGVTNMIPYFGPFIGAIPTILIVLLIMPSKVLLIAIFILILQQFDGIILGPKILGDTTGVEPLWIILSIIIGGFIAGPFGMFLGVPVFATIKLFFNEHVDNKYNEKYYLGDHPDDPMAKP